MLVYNGTKQEFMDSVFNQTIAEEIENKLLNVMNRHTAKSEFRSWENSLQYMYGVLNDQEIPFDSGIAIEYNIPQTSKRVDFLISGYDSNDQENVIIIELKQWDKINPIFECEALVIPHVETFVGKGMRPVVHPSYQAWSYAQLIKDYNVNVQNENIQLHPCACLHNYIKNDNDPLYLNQYKDCLDAAPAFTKKEGPKLRKFIKSFINKGDNSQILYKIDNGRIKPSKSLQNELDNMLKGNQSFIMIDDQKVVYEKILNISKRAMKTDRKEVIIVKGGPGTGKSVLAINLLAKLTMENQFVQYVTRNETPRKVYSRKLTGKVKLTTVKNMFKGSASYCTTPKNAIDTLLIDEAHRLIEKMRYSGKNGENQIKEIINASKCSVFFIDENQRVTISDIGSIKDIENWAIYHNANVTHLELASQFRCNGSDGYLSWVDNVLEIRETANYNLDGINYDIQIFDNPNEVKDLIFKKNAINNCSRILAGYCWDWIKGSKNDTNVYDIVIDDFQMSWNLEKSIFAIDDTSINEVGCVHTSQGLEFDYVGLIIGNDMRYENGKIITDYKARAKTDKSLHGIKKMAKNDPVKAEKIADEIIKNTYRTLMTRGMKGCYIYCTDKKLSEYLKGRIKSI